MNGKNSELRNPYTHKEATPQQTNDLLTFRSIGEKEFLQMITSFILKQPSTLAPNRKRHLLTFSEGQKKIQKNIPIRKRQEAHNICYEKENAFFKAHRKTH